MFAVQGIDKVLAFTSRLVVPVAHVREAYADPTVDPRQAGLRWPGTSTPGVVTAGTFYQGGQLVFWDVHNPVNAVVVELDHERYDQLVVEVHDPHTVVQAVWAAIRAQGAT